MNDLEERHKAEMTFKFSNRMKWLRDQNTGVICNLQT